MITTFVALLTLSFATIEATPVSVENLAAWNQFKESYGKSYPGAEAEQARMNIFLTNRLLIDQHNQDFKARKSTFELGINQFADMTNQEFRVFLKRYNGADMKLTSALPDKTHAHNQSNNLPETVDWRKKGCVSPVQDQGPKGEWWTFSATGALEGQNCKKIGKLVPLSAQNLADCVCKSGGQRCVRSVDQAFIYVRDNHGIDTADSYPPIQDGKCHFNASGVGATCTGYVDLPSGDESSLESALANVGPIPVTVDASQESFQFYKSGVYYEPHCSSSIGKLDHGLLAVGYGATDDGAKYYIVKNSWGSAWGDQGYILMSREKSNNCGIASQASYPLM